MGAVRIGFVVNEDGSPSALTVLNPISPGLDRAALDGLRRARFSPAMRGGTPVPVRWEYPVNFTIR